MSPREQESCKKAASFAAKTRIDQGRKRLLSGLFLEGSLHVKAGKKKIGEEFDTTTYLQVLKIVYLTMKKSCRSHGTLESAMVSSEKMRAWRRGAGSRLYRGC